MHFINANIQSIFSFSLLGMAGNNTSVHFISPVYEGAAVNMTCTFDSLNFDDFDVVYWERKTASDSKYKSLIQQSAGFLGNRYKMDFEYIFHDENSHIIKLLHAKKNDSGLYRCGVVRTVKEDRRVYPSPEKQFDVGKCFEHAVYMFAIYINTF